jgi:hypothetical protein
MPFAQITQHTNQRATQLEDRLAQEWESPEGDAAEPIIIEESERQRVPDHLYVIWSEWADLSQYERSKIVLNAYERVRGRSLALNVSLAMGLTVEEADRMGIEYSPVG